MEAKQSTRLRSLSLIALLLCIPACTTLDPTMVDAGRAFVDAVGPEYLAYVEKDKTLDVAAKERRQLTVRLFDNALKVREARR